MNNKLGITGITTIQVMLVYQVIEYIALALIQKETFGLVLLKD